MMGCILAGALAMPVVWNAAAGRLDVDVERLVWNPTTFTLDVYVGGATQRGFGSALDVFGESTGLVPVLNPVENDPNVDNRLLVTFSAVAGVRTTNPYQLQGRVAGSSEAYLDVSNNQWDGVNGTTYEFRCRSFSPTGVASAWSSLETGTCSLAPPGQIGAITPTRTSISWNAAARATGYSYEVGLQRLTAAGVQIFAAETLTGTTTGTSFTIPRHAAVMGFTDNRSYVARVNATRTNVSDGPEGLAQWVFGNVGSTGFIGTVLPGSGGAATGGEISEADIASVDTTGATVASSVVADMRAATNAVFEATRNNNFEPARALNTRAASFAAQIVDTATHAAQSRLSGVVGGNVMAAEMGKIAASIGEIAAAKEAEDEGEEGEGGGGGGGPGDAPGGPGGQPGTGPHR